MIKSPLERLGWLTSMAADRKIKESAHKVALYLASCCNKNSGLCNPMQDVIELHTGLCEKSVKNGIAQLKNGGYLKTERVGKLNHYTLLIPQSQGHAVTPETISQGQAVTPEKKVRGKLVPSQGQAGSKIGVTPCPCIEQGKEQGKNKKEAHAQLRKRFAHFYRAYPKKKDRGRAEQAFLKLKPDDQLLETMLTALENQTAEREWKEQAQEFVPEWKHPATWLNGKCWEDEIEKPNSKKSNGMPDRSEEEWQAVAKKLGIPEWKPPQPWRTWQGMVYAKEKQSAGEA